MWTETMEELLNKESDLMDEIYQRIQMLQTHNRCVVVYGESSELRQNFIKSLIQDVSTGKHFPGYKSTDHSSELDTRPGEDERRSYSFIQNTSKINKAKLSNRRRRLPLEDSRENENEFQESVNILILPEIINDDIMGEIEEAKPTAFVFLINGAKTWNHQDTFQSIISNIHYMCSSEDYFDPSSAMFIIHTDVYQDNLKHIVLEVLQRLWPGVCDNQIYLETLPRNLAIESLNAPCHALIESFYVMIQETEHRKIRQTYFWLKSTISSATSYIRSLIGQFVKAEDELESHRSAILDRQEKLTQVYAEGIEILEVGVERQTQTLKESILIFLDITSADFKQSLKRLKFSVDTFRAQNLTESESQNEIDIVILNSALAEFRKSLVIRDIVMATELGALQMIQTQFNLLHDEVEDIRSNAVRTVRERNSDTDDNDCNSNVKRQLLSEIRTTQCVHDLLRLDKAFAQGQEEIIMQIGDQWSGNAGLNDKREHDDEEQLILKAIRQLMTRFANCEDALNVVIKEFQAGARAYVASAKDKITRILSENIQMVNNISSCQEVFRKCKDHMLQVMEELESFRYLIEYFGSNYMVDEYSYSVQMSTEEDVLTSILGHSDISETPIDSLVRNCSGCEGNCFEGIWFKSHRTVISINDSKEHVLLKNYTNSFGKKTIISELAKLRCLESSFIAPFIGVIGKLAASELTERDNFNDTSSPGPVLIFKGDLVPCRMFLSTLEKTTALESNCTRSTDDKRGEFMITFVPSLLTALGYIHKHGLVHMELTLDTITVESATGLLKLSHICQPRTLTCPDRMANSYICFPPSVLNGGIYEPADDIYAFGLLLWELLYPHKSPYTEQKHWALKKFIELCSTSEKLERDLNMLELSECVYKILAGSLRFEKENSIKTPVDLLRHWRHLEETPDFHLLLRTNLQHDIQLPILDTSNNEDVESENLILQDSLSVDVALIHNQLTVRPDLDQCEDVHQSDPPIITIITLDPKSPLSPDDQAVNGATDHEILNIPAETDANTSNAKPSPPPVDPHDAISCHVESFGAMNNSQAKDKIKPTKIRRLDRGAQSFSETLNSHPALQADTLSRRRSKDDLDRRHSFSSDAPNQIGKLLSSAGDKSQKQSGSLFYRLFRKMTPSKSYDFNHFYDEPPQSQGKLRISKSERGARVVPDNDEIVVSRSHRVKSNSREDIRVLSFRISQEM